VLFISSFCFSSFSLSLTWLAVAGPPFTVLTWPPANLRHGDFGKSFVTARKSLRGFRKYTRRSTMTRPWRECANERFSKRRRRKTVGCGGESEAPQLKGFHCQYCCQNREWLLGECQETRSGPWRFALNGSWHSLQGSAALKKVSQLCDQNGLWVKNDRFRTMRRL
jgi:hypothetical protein